MRQLTGLDAAAGNNEACLSPAVDCLSCACSRCVLPTTSGSCHTSIGGPEAATADRDVDGRPLQWSGAAAAVS